MESQEHYLRSCALVRRWLLSQDDQFLTRDPEETDSSPSGDEWDTDSEDMLDVSEIHSSARDQNSGQASSTSYFVQPEHRHSNLLRCRLDIGECFVAERHDRDDEKSVVYESSFQGVYQHDDIPFKEIVHELNAPNEQCVYGSDAKNSQIVHEEDVPNEYIVYGQCENNEQIVYAQDEPPNEQIILPEDVQIVYMQEDALSERTVYVKDVQIDQIVYADVQNEHVAYLENGQSEQTVYIEEDAMNDQIVYIEEDAMNDQIVYIEMDAISDQTVYIEEDAIKDQIVYIQDDAFSDQIGYIEEGAIKDQIVYIQVDDAFSDQIGYIEEDAIKDQIVYIQVDDAHHEQIHLDQDPDLPNYETTSEASGCFGIEEGHHGYADYWHGLQHYEIGSEADSGVHKMY